MSAPRIAYLVALALAAGVAAQEPSQPADRGTHVFRALLHSLGLKPLAHADEAFENPAKSVVIVLGDPRSIDRLFGVQDLRHFIRSGMALFVATDQQTFFYNPRGSILINDLECGVYGAPLKGDAVEPAQLYRGHLEDCPLLQRPQREEYKSNSVDFLRGLPRVAANKPSYLAPAINGGRINHHRVFAELPEHCFPRADWSEPRHLLIGLADTLGAGRYVVMADHSIFINEMMLQLDNDNVAFTVRVVNWLTENGKRDRVLFLDDGSVRGDFDVNLDYIDPPLPHPDVLGPAVDRLWEGLEQEAFFDQTIRRLIPPYRVFRYLLLGATVAAMAFALYRVTAGRFRPDATAARLPEQLTELPGAAAPDADMNSAAREVVRAAFGHMLGGEPDFSQPPRPDWPRQARGLWELAARRSAPRMTPARLERLGRELDELQAAVSRGDIRLSRDEGIA